MKKLSKVFDRSRAAAVRTASFLRSRAAAVTGAVGTALAVPAAFATSVGGTAATAISGGEAEVELVQTALLGVLVILVVFGLIRKSLGK